MSQDEINQLLAAINAGDAEPEVIKPAASTRKIKLYDFKRPNKFTKEQVRTVSIMHETFARLTETSLSARLCSFASVHVSSVDQLTFKEYVCSLPIPATLAIINMDPLKGNAILEIDQDLTFSILNLLVGGNPGYKSKQHRLTYIESNLMEGIIIRLLGNLREAWTQVIDLRPRLGPIETNPQFAQIVPPTDMVLLVTLEAKIGDAEGTMTLCLPYLTIEPIVGKLSVRFWYASAHSSSESLAVIKENLNNAQLPLKAELFRTVCTFREIKSLKKDFILKAQRSQESYTGKLCVDNKVIAYFKMINDKRVEVTKVVKEKESDFMNEKHNVDYSVGDLMDVKIQVSVELGRSCHSIKEVLSIGEGTIIELDKLAGEPVDIFANNVKTAIGEVVVIDENFGVRVLEVLAPPLSDEFEETEEFEALDEEGTDD